MSVPEREVITFTPDHQARIEDAAASGAASHQAGMEQVLADAEATARRLTVAAGLPADQSLYGDHCVNCERRWALPADQASCAHKPICEDCWPNGCPYCEREVEDSIRRREEIANRILSAALELRTGADDLSESDMAALNWITRKDIAHHVELTIEALRRVGDQLAAQRGVPA